MEPTRVLFAGIAVSHPVAQQQISEFTWACLRRQDYAEGSLCVVLVADDPEHPESYWLEADAQEPKMSAPIRLFDLRIPRAGMEQEQFEQFLSEGGLAAYRHDKTDSLVLGGKVGAERPDSAFLQGKPVPVVGRNDACGCGSGKKYKRCCLQ